MENVSFSRDELPVLSDVNFTVDYGDFIAITGPNGGGKSTLLRLLLGLLKPDSGSITFFGTDGNPTRRLPSFGYLPQKNSVDSLFPITVKEVVECGLLCENMSKAERAERVAEALHTVFMSDLAARPIGQLSGGQLQRAMLARAIVKKPQVLVLDEPLSYVDLTFEARLVDIMAEISRNSTVLMVNHQMSRIGSLANRHILVDHILEECPAHIHYHAEE